MALLPSARTLATAAVVAGATALGASVGGMASVDRELAAAVVPPPAAQLERVAYVPPTAAEARADCPEWARDAAVERAEL